MPATAGSLPYLTPLNLLFFPKNLTLHFCEMKPDISIVIPAYNESERLGGPLKIVLDFISTNGVNAEVIVVDDGSSDDTALVAERVIAENPGVSANVVRYEQNRGKGFAVKTGLMAAKADVALFTDADLSTPIEEIWKLVDPIRPGNLTSHSVPGPSIAASSARINPGGVNKAAG